MKVYLVGAGPGGIDLLTVKALDLIKKADVIIYDYLANSAFLKYAKSGAELIYVGKKAGEHTLRQEEINKLIIAKAEQSQTVVRLKGGDPYIFGRGGEEAEALFEAGFDFEVVPGISSVMAGPTYAGIPLTHRNYTSSVTILTGHENLDKLESAHNWEALAKSANTLLFVMGMKNLEYIATKLLAAGLEAKTPASLIQQATCPEQKSLFTTLDNLAVEARQKGFVAPCLIVIGKVVTLHDKLNWFERLPLFGRKIIVTRSREQSGQICQELSRLGAEAIEFPTIKINDVQDTESVYIAVKHLSDYDWLIFTSANGVKKFWNYVLKVGKDARIFGQNKIAVIGQGTATALAEFGIIADLVPEQFIAESLAVALIKYEESIGSCINKKKILLIRAKQARDVLPEMLQKCGGEVNVLPVYETINSELKNNEMQGKANELKTVGSQVRQFLAEDKIDCITFASSSTVDNFFQQIPPDLVLNKQRLHFACIGPITRESLEKYGLTCNVQPENYTISDLVQAIVDKYN